MPRYIDADNSMKLTSRSEFIVKTLSGDDYDLQMKLAGRGLGKIHEIENAINKRKDEIAFREIQKILEPVLTEREILYLNRDNIIAAFKAWVGIQDGGETNYCHNCGAKMDKKAAT